MNGDGRSVGLEQAAGVLEVGHLPQAPPRMLPHPHAHGIKSEPVHHEQPSLLHEPRRESAGRESVGREPPRGRQKANGATQAPSGGLPKCDRAILSVLVQRGAAATRAQLAILSGYSAKSGAFGSALARLRALGYLVGEAGKIAATAAGEAGVGPIEPLPRGDELVEFWCSRVGVCGATILQTVLTVYPEELPRTVLAERTGYSAQSGAFGTALARLRALELMTGTRASDAFARAARGHLE